MPANNTKCVDLPSASVQYKSVSNQRSLNKNENDNDKDHDKDNDRLTTGDVFSLRSVDGDLGDWHNGSYVRASCGGGVRQAQANYQYEQINHVVLSNSNGGNANTGYCIGETIRKHKISTSIQGFCLSSCSRMWLGGVTRKLEGDESNVGLHGNFDILPALSR
jgi:ATP-dependent protease ClpP protease subunit